MEYLNFKKFGWQMIHLMISLLPKSPRQDTALYNVPRGRGDSHGGVAVVYKNDMKGLLNLTIMIATFKGLFPDFSIASSFYVINE